MNNWMLVKVKYTKQQEDGGLKRVTEPYLLAAMSFTDAETRIYEELGEIIRGEFNVVSIARQEIHDIFACDDSDVWYAAKIKYDSMDDDSGNSKKVTQNFLVAADSIKDAHIKINKELGTLLVDFEITSLVKSPIVEIFPYRETMDKEISRESAEEISEEN